MFEGIRITKLEKIGRTIGFGIAVFLFLSVFYYILSRFISFLDLNKYYYFIGAVILIYIIWIIIKGLR